MESKKLKLISGILFALLTIFAGFNEIIDIINLESFYPRLDIAQLAVVLGYLIITIGIFTDIKALRVTGSIIGVLGQGYILGYIIYFNVYQELFVYLSTYIDGRYLLYLGVMVMEMFVVLVYQVLLLVQNSIKKTHACKTIGIMAGSVAILLPISFIVMMGVFEFSIEWYAWVLVILYIPAPIFLGLFLYSDGIDDVLIDYAVAEEIYRQPEYAVVDDEIETEYHDEISKMDVHVEEIKEEKPIVEEPVVTNEETQKINNEQVQVETPKVEVVVEKPKEEPKKKASAEQAIKELMKLKELYELGIISKEELDQKKKELL